MLYYKLAKNTGLLCSLCFLQTHISCAQDMYPLPAPDTIRINFRQAEKMFLDNNLQLLAAHYNVQSAEALVEQARKWENPVLNTDQNIYSNNRFFEHGVDANGNPQGQIFVQVQQLIKTAGKRGRQVDLARTNATVAEWQFKSALRELKAILYRDFYTVVKLRSNAQLYNDALNRLNRLLAAQEQELKAGNIARKEYLRVQALVINLQQDIVANTNALNDAESEMKTILGITGNKFIAPVAPDTEDAALPPITISQLIDSARRNNTDYMQQVYQLQYNMQNLRLQKSLAVPDVTIGAEYDQASNYTPNFFGLAISLPLPLWDRNQGNIKAGKLQVKQGETYLALADQKLQNDVLNAYQKLLSVVKLSTGANLQFYDDYNTLQKNIMESYNNRQINLIEFLEYFNDYREVREKQLQLLLDLRLARQDVNDVTGTDIIK